MRTYNLFISHSWKYGNAYDKLCNLLINTDSFSWKNYSVPQEDPIQGVRTDRELSQAIERQIQPSSAVLILAGVYATYSKWIDREINIAKRLKKPIIAIEPWGSERTSTVVKTNADKIVRWNSESIIRAIREIA